MSSITLFKFQDSVEVRTVTDDSGEVLFVGKDVCKALGYSNHNDAMNDHCKGVAKRYPLQTAGGKQDARVLTEADVLRQIYSKPADCHPYVQPWREPHHAASSGNCPAYTAPQPTKTTP